VAITLMFGLPGEPESDTWQDLRQWRLYYHIIVHDMHSEKGVN
jgi:hypothetical protein